jgi:hypothetical protein
MMPKTSREESIPSLLRSGGQWYLVCESLAGIDKVPMFTGSEPPGAELSRWAALQVRCLNSIRGQTGHGRAI